MPELHKVENPAGLNLFREPAQANPERWQDGGDIKFQHGITRKADGYEEGLGSARVSPDIIVPLRDDRGEYYWWAYVGDNPNYDPNKPVGKDNHLFKFYKITSTIDHEDVSSDDQYDAEGNTIRQGDDYGWTGDTMNGIPYLTYGIPYKFESGKFVPFENIPRHPVGKPGETGYEPNGGEPRVRFKSIRSYRNFLIGMNFDTDDYAGDYENGWGSWGAGVHQNAVWWSHSIIGKNIDAEWKDADPTKFSGWNFLGGSGGAIIDGRVLRDSFVIYREASVWQMSYSGGVNVFAFKELFNDVGLLGKNCVLEIDGEHIVIGQSDVYRHNGVRKQTIADGRIRRDLFNSIDPLHSDKVFILGDYKSKEAWICIPEAARRYDGHLDEDGNIIPEDVYKAKYEGTCNIAYVYNWSEDTWAKKEIPNLKAGVYTILSIPEDDISWDAISEGGPVNATGDGKVIPGGTWETTDDTWADSYFKYNPADWGMAMTSADTEVVDDPVEGKVTRGKIYTGIKNQLRNGENFEGWVEKTYMDMGERLATKYMSRIYPLVRKGVVEVYGGDSMTLEEGIHWKYLGTFDPDKDEHLACRVHGRFLHVRFVIPETSRAELRGYWVEYDIIGRR